MNPYLFSNRLRSLARRLSGKRFSFSGRALVALLTAATLAACSSGPTPDTSAPTDPNAPKQFKVALLSPGPITDHGWNALGYEGLKAIESELGAVVGQQQVKGSPADREQGYRDFAARGFNVVIGHGGEFMDQALVVAKEFPNTKFIVVGGDQSAHNVVSLVFDLGQASYLAGAIAAHLSKTGKAGAVGGMKIPASSRTLEAFRNGAKSVKPDFDVTITYVGNWEDAAAARQQTLALIDRGADVIIHDCDAAAAGVFQAVKERNVLAFGVQKDQAELAPDNVVGSCVSNIPGGLLTVAKRIKEGKQRGEVIHLGITDNVIGFTMNAKIKGKITVDFEGQLNQTLKDIQEGKVDVFKEN